MKNLICSFVAICMAFSTVHTQNIELHSITTNRQPGGDAGYTLDGLRMLNHATPKLLNPDYFGEGIYPKWVNLTNAYVGTGSLQSIGSMSDIDIFYFGMFNKMDPSLNQFSSGEIDSLYAWSKRGGKLIIGGSAVLLNFNFNPAILNAKWGFSILPIVGPSPALQIMPSEMGASTTLFDGPFGIVSAANQGGLAQGYFNGYPGKAVVLGVDVDGNPNLILDCNTLDLIIADNDAFTDLGGMSEGFDIENDNDRLWLNTIAYMDQLQGPPVISQSGAELSTDTFQSYQWFLNGQLLTDATARTLVPTEEGDYTVKVSMSCGCTVTSEPHFFMLSSYADPAPVKDLMISPNPVMDVLRLEFTMLANSEVRVSIFNSEGKQMPGTLSNFRGKQGASGMELSVGDLPAGLYEVSLETPQGRAATKFLKL